MGAQTVLIGGLGPLSRPGLPWAGRELLDGMHLAVRDINRSGAAGHRTLELLFENTSGAPAVAVDAVNRLVANGAQMFAGEFHSVVANAILEDIGRIGLPFVCASATLDRITAARLPTVFRLSPPQSYGWRAYATYLIAAGIRHVIAIVENTAYWREGASVLESSLIESSVGFTRVDVLHGPAAAIDQGLASPELRRPFLLLVLGTYPENLKTVLHQLSSANTPIMLGDPPGRPIFRDWWEVVGAVGVPFLAYQHPKKLTDRGQSAAALFEREYGREPTFVALEGYDSILVLAAAIKEAGSVDPADVCGVLRHTPIPGTRGVIRFATEPDGVVHQQWKWAPTLIAAFTHPYQRFSDCDILWEATADLCV